MTPLKPSRSFVRLLALGSLALAVAAPAPWATSGVAAGSALQTEDHDRFRQRFEEAMKINATAEMSRLVRTMNVEAVIWIIETAEAISNQSSEALETRMSALRGAWREAVETDFCDKMYEYFALLDSAVKLERTKLRSRYDQARREFLANLEKKDGPTFTLLSARLEGLAQAFQQLGDKYYASQAWIYHGSCNREDNRGKEADLYVTCAAYKRAYQLREEIGLKDRLWLECKQFYESLARQGFDRERAADSGGGPGGPLPETEPTAAGAAVSAALGFQRVDDLFAYARPMYYADELYQTWSAIYLRGRGTTGTFTSMDGLSPTAHRVGSSEIRLDLDRDGQGDLRIPITGKWEPVEFQIGEGAERRSWACLTTVGSEKEYYQSLELNLAPTDDSFQVYFVPAASMVGEIGGVPVRVFDDNADGIYGSPPKMWPHRGLLEGALQPEMDSIAIGTSKRALPWSEYQSIGDRWYQLSSAMGGKELQASPVELEVGTLRLRYKGGKPAWLVVRGRGRLENSYFDIAEGKGTVPAGTYELFYGELRKGRKRQVSKAVILPSNGGPIWTVEAGGTTDVELGAPFSFDFGFEHQGDQLVVKGRSVVVVGSAGERYQRLWNCVPRPEVSWRETGSRRGSRPDQMGQVLDQEMLNQLGWEAIWFPLDMTIHLRGSPKGVEVQLAEKKNELFGKIESDWRSR